MVVNRKRRTNRDRSELEKSTRPPLCQRHGRIPSPTWPQLSTHIPSPTLSRSPLLPLPRHSRFLHSEITRPTHSSRMFRLPRNPAKVEARVCVEIRQEEPSIKAPLDFSPVPCPSTAKFPKHTILLMTETIEKDNSKEIH